MARMTDEEAGRLDELWTKTTPEIDYLPQKAQSACFTEKLAEAEREADKPNAVWLNEDEFCGEDG